MRAGAGLLMLLAACGDNASPRAEVSATHSSSIALSPAGDRLYVVDPDADSVAVIEIAARAMIRQLSLGSPAVDPTTGAFTPSVMPRALAVSPDGETLYVTGQRAGALFSIDVASSKIRRQEICSEPIGVVVEPAGSYAYVACSQDDQVLQIDAKTLEVAVRASVDREPWALAWSSDGALLVSHLTSPEVTALDPATLAPLATWTLPDIALRDNDARLAHGQPRGLYDLAPRPGTTDVWIPHIMLGTDTPQPDLDFETTAFPSLALVRDDGTYRRTLSVDVADIPRVDGAFGDIVSGPHALAFTSDGAYALVVDQNSEDVLVVDTEAEVEAALLRPLPGHMPDGIVLAADDSVAYVDERNTGDVAIVRIDRTGRTGTMIALAVDGTIPFRTDDPMPPDQRLGQHLFYSANSDEYPITRNHWVACASCHIEGRSDAVTWLFSQGPRDTPTNAGGMLGTGFLFRTADRTQVQDYWKTVNVEQGGRFDPDAQRTLLDPLAAYVNLAIPAPVPPTTDPTLVERGRALFQDPAVGCAGCHSGPHFTDSAAGNAVLDLAGPVVLHDVGTCATADAAYPDVEHSDRDGHLREACMFDTPSLIGIASSPPYFHDGRAATLIDALEQTRGTMGHIEQLTPDDLHALVEYVRSL